MNDFLFSHLHPQFTENKVTLEKIKQIQLYFRGIIGNWKFGLA